MSVDTSHVFPLPASGDDPDDIVRWTVKALLGGAGLTAEALGPHVGISTSAIYQRLKQGGPRFTGGEIYRIAEYFGVPIEGMFDGRYLPSQAGRARLGSNQRPTVYKVAGPSWYDLTPADVRSSPIAA